MNVQVWRKSGNGGPVWHQCNDCHAQSLALHGRGWCVTEEETVPGDYYCLGCGRMTTVTAFVAPAAHAPREAGGDALLVLWAHVWHVEGCALVFGRTWHSGETLCGRAVPPQYEGVRTLEDALAADGTRLCVTCAKAYGFGEEGARR